MHLIPIGKSVSRILGPGSSHSCQLPAWPCTIMSTARVCFSLPEIQTQSTQKRDLLSFQSTLRSMERTNLLIIIYLSSPEQQRISLQAVHVPQCHRHCSLCILTTSRNVEPKYQRKLEKATVKAHFIPLFSSKMSNNRKLPLAFSIKCFSKFNVADPTVIWRIVLLPITSLTNSGGGRGAHSFSFSGIGTVFSCKNKPTSHQYLLGAKSKILTHCWNMVCLTTASLISWQ